MFSVLLANLGLKADSKLLNLIIFFMLGVLSIDLYLYLYLIFFT